MSDKTSADLDAAIRAHIADERDNALVTGWSIIVAHADESDFAAGRTGYWVQSQDSQPHHATLGLVHHFRTILENEAWIEDDDDFGD